MSTDNRTPDYRVISDWMQLRGDTDPRYPAAVADVAVDADDCVYLLARLPARVIVLDREGNFIRSFGEGRFSPKPHGIAVGPDGIVYCVDDGAHVIHKFTKEGEPIGFIGNVGPYLGIPSDTGYQPGKADFIERLDTIQRTAPPFHRPTSVAFAGNGEMYVSDGYGNAAIHHFSREGKLLHTWGAPGGGPGEFRLPHHVFVSGDGRVFVSDRENGRIQLFSLDGTFLEQWADTVDSPTACMVMPDGLIYVTELGRVPGDVYYPMGKIRADNQMQPRVSVLDRSGKVLARWGRPGAPCAPGNFVMPHGIAADTRGDIYVVELAAIRERTRRGGCHSVQKFTRL